MSLIRTQPSAVGAFEAQVFDMGRTYKTIMTQAAAQRKAQADAKKEMDKMMANTYSTKGKGRLQDMPELEKQYQELQNYYINNNSAILKGGKESLEFQKMRSNFIFEADEANMRKERDKQLSPFFKMNLEKEGMSEKSTELMTIFNLPYNDPRRKDYRYEGADGQMHGIDELNVADVDKYRRFDEIELIKEITDNAKPRKISNIEIEPSSEWGLSPGYKIAVTDEVELKDPVKISQIVTAKLISKPDARNTYKKMFDQQTPEDLQEATKDIGMFNSIYKAAGYGQIVNFEKDDIKGISTPEEFAIYRNLKANLPQELGEKISTSLMTAQLAKEGLDLKKRQFGEYLSQKQKEYPIDVSASLMLDQIGSGEFTPQKVNDLRNFAKGESMMIGNPYMGTGGLIPGFVDYVAPGETEPKRISTGRLTPNEQNKMGNKGYLVYTYQKFLTKKGGFENKEDIPITDLNEARTIGGTGVTYGRKDGKVFMTSSIRIPVDNNVVSPVVRSSQIKSSYGVIQDAQQGNVMYDINMKRLQGGAGGGPLGGGATYGRYPRGGGFEGTYKTWGSY